MKTKKRDFWDKSLNIVKGCNGLNGKHCPYCYACRIVKRRNYAHMIADKEMEFMYGQHWPVDPVARNDYEIVKEKILRFEPHFFEYVYAQPLRKKPTIYFFSMSDPAYWEYEWYERIVQKIAENMQHTFVVLTKQPKVYENYIFPNNTILGITVNDTFDFKYAIRVFNNLRMGNKKLLCIEPIQEKIKMSINDKNLVNNINWIHVGEESGNRKGRTRATKEMIDPIFNLKDIPVFMKDNLSRLYPGKLRKEVPEL